MASLRRLYRLFVPEPVPPCDPETLEVLTRTLARDSCAVDVGANRGSILREIVRLAPDGRHFAFEPIPRLFRWLTRRFPGVTCRQFALSDAAGSATFNYFERADGFSGLLRRPDVETQSGAARPITVETARLDDVVPVDVRVAFIKIDVEGAEFRVLMGARETLRRCRPVVVFECGKGGLDQDGRTPEQVFDLLASLGMELRPLIGWPEAPPLMQQGFADAFRSGEHYMWVASPAT